MSAALERLSAVPRRVRRNLTDYGLGVTAGKIAGALASPLYTRRVYRLYRISLSPDLPEPDAPEGFEVRLMGADEADAIREVEGLAEWLGGTVGARITSGDLCVVAFSGRSVAGFNLITFGAVVVPPVALRRTFRPGTAWSEHIATSSAFRRRGVATALRRRVFFELGRRGVRRLYGGALTTNHGSLELARRVGFGEFADVEYRRLAAFRSWRFRRVRSNA